MSRLFKKDIPSMKVVSKEEEFWLKAKERAEESIKNHEDVLKLERAMVETCENKIRKLNGH